MSCRLIDYSSPYLDHLPNRDEQRDRISAAIDAASLAIERYCRRKFAVGDYSEVSTVDQFGCILLKNFPIVQVRSFATQRISFFSVHNDTHTTASVATEDDQFVLRRTGAEVALKYADYPTITELVEAINDDSGWEATSLMGAYASGDLVSGVWQDAKQSMPVDGWIPSGRITCNFDAGYIYFLGVSCGAPVRVSYSAGFSEIPADLQQLCAELAANIIDDKQGQLATESLGGYSYSLLQGSSAIARLPISRRKVLDSYKDQRL